MDRAACYEKASTIAVVIAVPGDPSMMHARSAHARLGRCRNQEKSKRSALNANTPSLRGNAHQMINGHECN